MTIVKGTGKRAEKARKTRQKILAAAGELFVEHGYGATTLQDVANAAGVAVQTIYFVFGNKRTVMKELVDVTIAGDDEPVPTVERRWYIDALASGTAAELLERLATGASDVTARVAPILKVAETAAAMDPELSEQWRSDEDPRYTVIKTAATELVTKPDAREDLTVDEAADIMYGLLSPELFLVMVKSRGWEVSKWREWTVETLQSRLCAPPR